MSALGKFQASLNSVTQETSVALANLNVDLSLFKVEAPPEYRELGVALSRRQRAAAEDGPPHTTARRLGSLFQSIIPETPCLIRAYGQRASEIAQSPESNPKGSVEDGPFRDFVGADGTSIWAAATSGPAAIAAHLLACMLASMWTAEEAVAIWEEIISERKRRLEATSVDGSFTRIEDAVATRLDITREQITIWDASARSWLKAAADAPAVRDRQQAVRSSLKTVTAFVNPRADVFTSVTEAWKTALETMEKVICGASYSVQDGAVIIALLCWHLYPDFVILGSTQTEGRQGDTLVRAGGVITIGLTGSQGSGDQAGVHWSLSLGHMRFYGGKVKVKRSTTADDGRVTFDEFVVVLLGAIVGLWEEEEHITREDALEFIEAVLRHVDDIVEKRGIHVEYIRENSWVAPLLAAIQSYRASGLEGSRTRKLFDLGHRRQHSLRTGGFRSVWGDTFANDPGYRALSVFERNLAPQNKTPLRVRLFGLDGPFVEAIRTTEDKRVYLEQFVRRAARAAACNGEPTFFILGRLEPDSSGNRDSRRVFMRQRDRQLPRYQATFYCATPRNRDSSCGEFDMEEIPIVGAELEDRGSLEGCMVFWGRPPARVQTLLRQHRARRGHCETTSKRAFLFRVFDLGTITMRDGLFLLLSAPRSTNSFMSIVPGRSEVLHWIRSGKLGDTQFLRLWGNSGLIYHLKSLSIFARMHNLLPDLTLSTAVFFGGPRKTSGPPLPPGYATGLFQFFRQLAEASPTVGYRSKALLEVYGRLHSGMQFLVPIMNRTQAFVVLAFFHTGRPSVTPNVLYHAFAISIENSLYIAASVVSDPASDIIPYDIRVVRGTTGRPGISVLSFNSGVSQTEVRQTDDETWHVINHSPFDGKLEDCFKDTSLHLRFTGYEHFESAGNADRGARFSEITHLEALVSTHERGSWVGDIEPVQVLDPLPLHLVVAMDGCPGETAGTVPPCPLVSIENWEELLDPPASAPGVFKAHGNWQARLAAACICARLGHLAIVFKDHGCWNCALAIMTMARDGRAKRALPQGPPGPMRFHLVPSTRWSLPKDNPDSDSDVSDSSTASTARSRSVSPRRSSEDDVDKSTSAETVDEETPEPNPTGIDNGDESDSSSASSFDSDVSRLPPRQQPLALRKVIFIL